MRTRIGLALFLTLLISIPARADTLATIAQSKILHLGFIDGEAPFASKGDDGKPVGYAIDLCSRVAEAIRQKVPDLQITYSETTLTDAFHDIAVGKIDLLCGAVTATLARRELVDFSQPIFITGMSALMMANAPADIRDLLMQERQVSPPRSPMLRAFASHIFGARAGSTTEDALRMAMQALGVTASIVPYDSHADGLAALQARQIDAYFGDRSLLDGLLARAKNPQELMIADRWFTHEPYALALPRGDSDFRLLVDRALSTFYPTPDFTALMKTYFGSDAEAAARMVLTQSLPLGQ